MLNGSNHPSLLPSSLSLPSWHPFWLPEWQSWQLHMWWLELHKWLVPHRRSLEPHMSLVL